MASHIIVTYKQHVILNILKEHHYISVVKCRNQFFNLPSYSEFSMVRKDIGWVDVAW